MDLPRTAPVPVSARSLALRDALRRLGVPGVAAMVALAGCGWAGREYWLARYQREIDGASHDLANARTDAERSRAYSARGAAYSEKARYSRTFKLISSEEYVRLFDLAIADHDRAVGLAPGDAGLYLARGLAYYWRAVLEDRTDQSTGGLFGAARADFTSAIERDPRDEQAFDMRGLVSLADEDLDDAIRDFSEVMKLDARLGRIRLADAYCRRGESNVRTKKYDVAIADFEKSIAMEAPSDGCDCQPDSPLAWTYLETGQVDKSWAAVRRARRAGRWIMPELIERLRKVSGRDG